MIAAAFVVLVALVAAVWATTPLRHGPRRDLPKRDSLLAEIEARKTEALAAIVEAERDKETGKLSDEDFAELRAEYEVRARAAMAEADALTEPLRDEEIEAEIAAARAKLACPRCGALRVRGAGCPSCGLPA